MSKFLKIDTQIVKSSYTNKEGKEVESYTLQVVLPGRKFLVKPINSKNYGAIVELAEDYPDSVIEFEDKKSK